MGSAERVDPERSLIFLGLGLLVGFFVGLLHAVPYNGPLRFLARLGPKTIGGHKVRGRGLTPVLWLEFAIRELIGNSYPLPQPIPSMAEYDKLGLLGHLCTPPSDRVDH